MLRCFSDRIRYGDRRLGKVVVCLRSLLLLYPGAAAHCTSVAAQLQTMFLRKACRLDISRNACVVTHSSDPTDLIRHDA